MIKRVLSCLLLVGVVAFAFASKGGGGEKKKSNIPLKTDFTPIRTTTGFTLKAGPAYRGSYFLSEEKDKNAVSYNTLITYQKGNTIFILPSTYRVNINYPAIPVQKSNLQLLDLKIKMHK